MEPKATLHFHNAGGLRRIIVSVKEFMCIGDLPPFDHPHIFIDMGAQDEVVCPYCSTVFVYDATLHSPCYPPQCEYRLEPETEFSGPAPDAVLERPAPMPPKQERKPIGAVIASFSNEGDFSTAYSRLSQEGIAIQSYAPFASDELPIRSSLRLVILFCGLLGVAAGFGMQAYANVISYPLDIGGRPKFSWPAFIPIAFEIGVLFAVLAGFFGFLAVTHLPRLYEEVDECAAMQRAMRDRWVLAVRYCDAHQAHLARAILGEAGANDIEEKAA
jgi:uncharacterized Zn-finger protein